MEIVACAQSVCYNTKSIATYGKELGDIRLYKIA